MSDLEEEEDGAESVVSDCLSMKSDFSKDEPPFFSNEPGPSDTKLTLDQKMSDLEEEEDGAESVVSDCLSMKSDFSKDEPPFFSNEPGPSDTKERKMSDVSVEEQRSRSRTRAELQTAGQTSTVQMRCGLQNQHEHKIYLKRTCEHATEGAHKTCSETPLNRIYNELYITEGWSEEVNTQHECLETALTPESHTGDNLAEALRSSLQEVSPDKRKLACITTDNGANVVAVVQNLGWQRQSEDRKGLHAHGFVQNIGDDFLAELAKEEKAAERTSCAQHAPTLLSSGLWGTKQKMVDCTLEQAFRRALDEQRGQHLILTW
ncbi:hypothetical protein PFLUV_G00028420 [Perca fluviatilis]|uniref:FISNA domain-containing protein n=1 Tax=Perca fluviatilis TaxID=8168 RepID=A0A6A5FLD4_PERFL|nr:hypothetical protein PFLUV_G00028420 [Perca fluviatilis]